MNRINILDQETINKIAAGEVVERPASVVKELVENSIDAGATAVSVYIEGGGADLIRITDNGSGFLKDDIRLAFKKNTTSKIAKAEDIFGVLTFGFRGEALSSVAAVAKVELLTKLKDELTGVRFLIEGGEEKAFEEAGCPDGTTLIIKDLFFNTPVRRKFLKSASTEAGYVGEVCERIALSHPEVAIKLVNGGKQVLSTTGNGNIKETVYLIYGRSCAEQLINVDLCEGDRRISGVIAKPVISRGNRNHENIFLNGRFIRNPLLSKAIEEGYRTYLMQNRFPLTVLNLTLPTAEYDINVHPSKLEVRFVNSQEIYEFVFKAVFDSVKFGESIVEAHMEDSPRECRPETPKAPEPFEFNRRAVNLESVMKTVDSLMGQKKAMAEVPFRPDEKSGFTDTPSVMQKDESSVYADNGIKDISPSFVKEKGDNFNAGRVEVYTPRDASYEVRHKADEYQQSRLDFLAPEAKKHHRIIGQLFETYWLIEYEDKLYIIDQHAAHERVLFEKFSKEIRENRVNSQLLFPAPVIELNTTEADKLERSLDKLNAMGYEIEHFGGRQYRILAVPEVLTPLSKEELLIEFIDSLTEDLISGTLDTVQDRIATMSCKAAVKGNMKLSSLEAEKLINDLMELENPFHCPHGRPIEISLSKYEIEKKFKRIV